MSVDFYAHLFYGMIAEQQEDHPYNDSEIDILDVADIAFDEGETRVRILTFDYHYGNNYLAVADSYHTCSNYNVIELDDFKDYGDGWDKDLEDFCDNYGFVWSQPKWILGTSID